MKVKNIRVENFKAIDSKEINLDGCSAIITAGNDKGKSSLLSGLIKRFQGQIPSLIVKTEEKKGFNIMTLSDGSRIEWNFTDKSESFAYITKDGIKQTTGVLKQIGKKYFGINFSIDKFISSSPKEQTTMLSKLIGFDFSKIDKEYKEVYNERTILNRDLKKIKAQDIQKPLQVEDVDIESLYKIKDELDYKNEIIQREHQRENEEHLNEILKFNQEQENIEASKNDYYDKLEELHGLMSYFGEAIDIIKAEKIADSAPSAKQTKELKSLEDPVYFDTKDIEQEIRDSSQKKEAYNNYKNDLEKYINWREEINETESAYEDIDYKLKNILAKKQKMIQNSELPKEFSFDGDTILYNGFSLTDSQISSSSKYIASLKLGSLALGELKTMHFDASFLDKNSLSKVKSWADKNGYQLLIERPDFDCGEIRYEILENN
jgi:hypothetical protein